MEGVSCGGWVMWTCQGRPGCQGARGPLGRPWGWKGRGWQDWESQRAPLGTAASQSLAPQCLGPLLLMVTDPESEMRGRCLG